MLHLPLYHCSLILSPLSDIQSLLKNRNGLKLLCNSSAFKTIKLVYRSFLASVLGFTGVPVLIMRFLIELSMIFMFFPFIVFL